MKKKKFLTKLDELVAEAVKIINNYKGNKVVTLKTDEKAIDNDDAWIIIGGDGPIIRDKRDQRIREAYLKEGGEYPETMSSDSHILDDWDYETILEFADKL